MATAAVQPLEASTGSGTMLHWRTIGMRMWQQDDVLPADAPSMAGALMIEENCWNGYDAAVNDADRLSMSRDTAFIEVAIVPCDCAIGEVPF